MTDAPRSGALLRGTLMHWAVAAATILYTFLVTPVVVRALRPELYGVWSFINSMMAYTTLLYLGLGAALFRFGAAHRARGDVAAYNRLFSVVYTVYLGLGIVVVLAAAVLGLSLGKLLANPLDPSIERMAGLACLLVGARVGMLTPASAYSAVLWSHDRPDLAEAVPLSATLLRTLAVPLAIGAESPLIGLAAVFLASSVCEWAALYWLAHRAQPALRWIPTRPTLPELKMLYGYGLQAFGMQMAMLVIGYTDSLVIGMTLGATAVAIYSFPLQLAEYGKIPVRGILIVRRAGLTAAYSLGQRAVLGAAFLKLARAAGCMAAVVNVNLAFLGPPFVERWVGREFAAEARTLFLMLGAAAFVQTLSTLVHVPFHEAIGDLKPPLVFLGGEALLNLALSLALVRRLGLDGVALGSLIASVAVSMALLPLRTGRLLGVSLLEMVRRVLLPSLVVVAASASVHVVGALAGFELASYPALFVWGLASTGVGLLATGLAWPGHERSLFLAQLRSSALSAIGRTP